MISRSECFKCGACCIAFDIKALGKKVGEVCSYMTETNLCSIYKDRPDGCKYFLPDEICVLISTLSLRDKVKIIRNIYGI